MPTLESRRNFLRGTGSLAAALLVAGCKSGAGTAVPQAAPAAVVPPPVEPPSVPTADSPMPVPPVPDPPAPDPVPVRPPPSPAMLSLQAFLRARATPGLALPMVSGSLPSVSLAGPLSFSGIASTTLPDGIVIPLSNILIGGPVREKLASGLAGNPTIDDRECFVTRRRYVCKSVAREFELPLVLRFRTDAAVLELAGVMINRGGNGAVQSMLVDGRSVPPHVLSVSSRGASGGYTGATIRVDFGTTAIRDIWIKTTCYVAYLRIGRNDTLYPPSGNEPQMTVVGDSYQCSAYSGYGEIGELPFDIGLRLGLRDIAVDAVRGSGYWNSGEDRGNFRDRLASHGTDDSAIFLVVGGINDYGDVVSPPRTVWPARTDYERAVADYLSRLRAARPDALIVVTAPFCPNPTLSDASFVANSATNSSGLGDFLYKAQVQKDALRQIAGPWVYIDTLMGGGWLNSAGATGDVTNLQWFTGGTPAAGTSVGYRPGSPTGGGGGAFGGIARIPVLSGGVYAQAPDVRASGGSGRGLLLSSSVNSTGALTAIHIVSPGQGYAQPGGLPTISIDSTYQQVAAVVGEPELVASVNPDGRYPLPEMLQPGVSGDLNNIRAFLLPDAVHPSPAGVDYLSGRLARSIHDAVMAL